MSANGSRKMIDRFVTEAEDAISKIKERIRIAESELERMRKQEAEARTTYQGLRNIQKGIQPTAPQGASAVKEAPAKAKAKARSGFVSDEDFIEAIKMMGDSEFTATDIAELTGQMRSAAQMRLKSWANSKRMIRITEKGGRHKGTPRSLPMKFRQLRPPV